MRVGDKVVCIARVNEAFKSEYPEIVFPEYRQTYTVRDFCVEDGSTMVVLIEIVNKCTLLKDGMLYEPHWPIPELMVLLELSTTTYGDIMEEIEELELQTA